MKTTRLNTFDPRRPMTVGHLLAAIVAGAFIGAALAAMPGCAVPPPEPKAVTAPVPVPVTDPSTPPPAAPDATSEAVPADQPPQPAAAVVTWEGTAALFDYDRSALTAESQANLDALVGHVPEGVLVVGHCDERGTEEYNLGLGWQRGQVVKRYLEALGVRGMRVVSKGELEPLCRDGTEYCHAKNRRVELQGGE